MDNGESSYRRFLAGDIEGLHEIINTYHPGLMLYLNSFVQNLQLAEELTGDTFAELAIKRPSFSGRSSFKTWLYTIGRNHAAKYIRKHSKLDVIPLESQKHLADEEDLERNYIQNEQKRTVHQALHTEDFQKGVFSFEKTISILQLFYRYDTYNRPNSPCIGKSRG